MMTISGVGPLRRKTRQNKALDHLEDDVDELNSPTNFFIKIELPRNEDGLGFQKLKGYIHESNALFHQLRLLNQITKQRAQDKHQGLNNRPPHPEPTFPHRTRDKPQNITHKTPQNQYAPHHNIPRRCGRAPLTSCNSTTTTITTTTSPPVKNPARTQYLHNIMHLPIMIPHIRHRELLPIRKQPHVPKLPPTIHRPHGLRENRVVRVIGPRLPNGLPVLARHPDHHMHRARFSARKIPHRAETFVPVHVAPQRESHVVSHEKRLNFLEQPLVKGLIPRLAARRVHGPVTLHDHVRSFDPINRLQVVFQEFVLFAPRKEISLGRQVNEMHHSKIKRVVEVSGWRGPRARGLG
ncbi:lysozyme [Striga asiatica]|uniref:Lysozyme n=1 Tax=Striga asiatica TaxID=4170 RepID=A0A5A7QIR8_STRAF|nr:lysozyme [Striga asiatica]